MDHYEELDAFLESHKGDYEEISDRIWAFAEPRFQEYRSSALQQEYLAKQGFEIKADLAGEQTAFLAEYGSGKPVIAFLGEFDALSGLSQAADRTERIPLKEGKEGHGCGHNLLGTAALAATAALKNTMEQQGLTGTIRYYGCPAEESASGKAYLVRDGYFDDCDLALTWHPSSYTKATNRGSLANMKAFFQFHGRPSHASSAPERGRSALDAVELMNVGANFLREHMIPEARIHYAITDAGGDAPNVVQGEAQVLYNVRAPKITQVQELYERVCDVARGAALMTGTTVDIRLAAVCADYIPNPVILSVMDQHIKKTYPIAYDDSDYEYAEQFKQLLTPEDQKELREFANKLYGKTVAEEILKRSIFDLPAEIEKNAGGVGSTDVGDVSWVIPTGQFTGVTMAQGTPGHTWQLTAQGKSDLAHKGLLAAAKVLARTGYDFLTNPALVEEAAASFKESLGGETYPNLLPKDMKPEIW